MAKVTITFDFDVDNYVYAEMLHTSDIPSTKQIIETILSEQMDMCAESGFSNLEVKVEESRRAGSHRYTYNYPLF